MKLAAAVIGVCVWSSAAMACESVAHRDQQFTVCEVPEGARIELFLRDAEGAVLGTFARVKEIAEGSVIMAMNAGMYHDDRRPVGLYIEDSAQETPLVTREGPGNFGLLPNGVFCIRESRADVIESRSFERDNVPCVHATQSGPMLVINGVLHPRFVPNSTFRNLRNGVGTSADGQRVVLAISDSAVTFHEFATLFRDVLEVPNALYFDGRVSRLFAPDIGRDDFGLTMGPIVAVIVD